MLYVFADETYSDQSIRFACIAVRQAYFGSNWSSIAKLASQGIPKRTSLVSDFLLEGDYRTVVTDLNLVESQAALATLWTYADSDGVSPRDDLWLQAFGYSIAYALRLACLAWVFETVDVLHDPKSLQGAHEEAYQSKLREVVHRRSSREVAQARPALRGRVKIRRINAVPKPEVGQAFTKFQQGTWLAHWAAKISPPNQGESSNERFLYRDLTSIVLESVEEMQKRKRGAVVTAHNTVAAQDG